MTDSISELIKSFIKIHPEYDNSVVKQDVIISAMIKDNFVSASEIEKIKHGGSLWNNAINSKPLKNYDDVNLLWGADFSNNNSAKTAIKYNTEIPELVLDKDGKIDMNQFTNESLSARYPNDKYSIIENKGEHNDINIKVIDKKTGKPVYAQNNFIALFGKFYDENGNEKTTFMISNGVLCSKFDLSKGNANKEISSYDKNGDIESKTIFINNETYNPDVEVFYSDGVPYKEVNNKTKEEKNYLAEDLKADIYAKNGLGFPTTRISISENVIKRINYKNVEDVMINYEKITGNNLISDLEGEIGLNQKLKIKLINNITSKLAQTHSNYSVKYISDGLFKELNSNFNGNIERYVKMINSMNYKNVMETFSKKSEEKTKEIEDEYKNILNLADSFGLNTDNIVTLYNVDSKLINAILIKPTLSKEQKLEFVKHIADAAIKDADYYKKYTADLQDDVVNNTSTIVDAKKVNIDIKRIEKRAETILPAEVIKPNGKLDVDFKQGLTGDCWLLGTIASLISRPEGKKMLEELLHVDEKNKTVTVNLKGVNKKYKISFDEIKNSHHLSAGDGDLRAFEIAFDRLVRDEAYLKNDLITFDINGNTDEYAYKVLTGKEPNNFYNSNALDSLYVNYVANDKDDIKRGDDAVAAINKYIDGFNDKNKAFCTSVHGINDHETIEGVSALNSKKEKVEIYKKHLYAIVGSNKDYVYLINPHDSSVKLEMSRKDFIKSFRQYTEFILK